jgi:hypothetical protein
VVLHSPDNAADARRMLDWGFGRGRSARTGQQLPAYVPPASVAALLARPPAAGTRRRSTVSEALAAAGLARVQATPARPPTASRDRRPWQDRRRLLTGAGALAALLAAVAIAVHRSRQRT